MNALAKDPFRCKSVLTVNGKSYTYYRIDALSDAFGDISRLPYSIKVLLEAALRHYDGVAVTEDHIRRLAAWTQRRNPNEEVPFTPARVLLHDTTGLPALVDLSAMRETMHRMGGDVSKVNPLIPVDVTVCHSVTVDSFGSRDALRLNEEREMQRNQERFRFFRWAQQAYQNLRIVPPSTGIMHQINMEFLSSVTVIQKIGEETVIYPDTLIGTDSHTTMINGMGIVAWGVGGIEAEAAMLGQPLYLGTPEVVGLRLTGSLPEGTTATDLALTITNLLRKKGVVGKFVEFIGPGARALTLADRATIANMAPEYGATMGYFPLDAETIRYMREIGRSDEQIAVTEAYYKAQGLYVDDDSPEPSYSELMELDLSTVVPSLAGPKRPQDRIALADLKTAFRETVTAAVSAGGYGVSPQDLDKTVRVRHPGGGESHLKHGAVVLAAITSCTNTSNPSVLIGAGLLARKAVERGLTKPAYVKSSLTPGSRVVTDYLEESGLLRPLEQLGFHIAGYGCATCIGNSGPLPAEVAQAIEEHQLTVAAVLSGNRNFEGRIHPQIKANYLASPPLVVAYALAGTVDIDFAQEPIGLDRHGEPVFLKDLWPTSREIDAIVKQTLRPELFRKRYGNVYEANPSWNQLEAPGGMLYPWDKQSTYIQEPPFLKEFTIMPEKIVDIRAARVLLKLGDSVTTDHASPSGSIKPDSPAGRYLQSRGVSRADFNSYPSRRGNHEVMVRGAFANVRLRNQLVPGSEGGITKYWPTGEIMSIYDAAMKYKDDGTPLVILAGKEYGTGSSRDWAAKGPLLLGVRMILAESFERIHRSNLVGMGILPLQFKPGQNADTLGLTGEEVFSTVGLDEKIRPGQTIKMIAVRHDRDKLEFEVVVRLDNPVEVDYYLHGGIMPKVMRKLLQG
ncbi:aconitate hydratase AcnA [Brevibacillus marinus]|uniref:aconitate hydratase AcnA n=1 Tax=Brevibacillus marinus TaxID=2496837 RepID=UPI000F83365B|nr:aconitate hydratase AcnA [Brevibacillus marinus]